MTGPGAAQVLRLDESRLVFRVGRPGTYRVATSWSPYWRTYAVCVSKGPRDMLLVTATRAGRVALSFDIGAMWLLHTLVDSDGRRCA